MREPLMPDTTSTTTATDTSHLADLLMAAARGLRRGAASELREAGLTWGQARVLRILAQANRPLPMSVLAQRLGVVPRSATDAVDGLVERSLVVRTADETDRRRVLVGLTRSGRALLTRSDAARRASAEQMLSRLGPRDRHELQRLLSALQPPDDEACQDHHPAHGEHQHTHAHAPEPAAGRTQRRAASETHEALG